MANLPNKLSNNSPTKAKSSAPASNISKKSVKKDIFHTNKSMRLLDNFDESITEGNHDRKSE